MLRYADLVPPDPTPLHVDPPARFGTTSFADYVPQHPSQVEAVKQVQAFTLHAQRPVQYQGGSWFWQASSPVAGSGLYLDGGFGVGKTHLLAAAYHAFEAPSEQKAYLSFQSLVYGIGAEGRAQAEQRFSPYRLICIDEFELDDPGNTLIVKNFLNHVFSLGHHVITTSNTPPAAQGQGRFNAEHFQREIQSIASAFRIVRMEGKDYRQRAEVAPLMTSEALHRCSQQAAPTTAYLTWAQLMTIIQDYHPSRFHAIVEPLDNLFVDGVCTIETQNDALRFVHFIDTVYNARIGVRLAGNIPLEELFASLYRDGAYAKKHYRCVSRLSEMLREPLQHSQMQHIQKGGADARSHC